ncbi:MAG: hypothetical protein ACTHNG_15045 [Ginsengibacter sp.]
MKNNPNGEIFDQREIHFLCRIVFSFILIDLIFAAFSNTLNHQLHAPVLKFPFVDPTFLLMHILKIPQAVSSNLFVAWVWDVVMFVMCICVILFPGKKWLILTFIFFYFVYYIIFNSYGVHHTHSLAALLITPFVFLFSKKNFSFAWQGLRYFLLFAYSGAFLWKFFRFSWLQSDQGTLILKRNLTPYLFLNPDTFLSKIYWWFLDHPFLIEVIFIAGFVMEGLFLIGFFTRKFDKVLFILSLLLPIGFWFLSDAVFYEMLVLSLTLLPTETIKKFSGHRPKTSLYAS